MRWLSYTKVSAQNDLSNYVLDNKHWTFSSKARFNSLATPICFQIVKCLLIPLFWPNRRNWFLLYFSTLSNWIILIFLSACFSINFFHFSNKFRTTNGFSTSTFDYYSKARDPVKHIRHFWDKMIVHSCNDALICLAFSPSLKGVASNWFYSLPSHSLHNFEKVTKAFLTQYASRREAKKNNHHLLSVNMRQDDNLKSYIGYFQSQLAKVFNCSEDVSALTFISGLQIFHTLYKHLLKHDVTRISEVLV